MVPLRDMDKGIGPGITETFGIGHCADSQGIHDNHEDAFESILHIDTS